MPVEVQDLDAETLEVLSGLLEGERVLIGPNLQRIGEGIAVEVDETAYLPLARAQG